MTGSSLLNKSVVSPPCPIEAINRLSIKGAARQWRSADAFAGNEKIFLPRWLQRSFPALIVSQFYHGEQATLAMCRKLLAGLENPEERRCIRIQTADEKRHAEVYRAYLAEFGNLAPVNPVLEAAYEKALAWNGPPEALVAAFSIILEGEALYALDYLGGWFPCPRFRRINGRIAADEARHVAFGRIYLGARLPAMPRERRFEIYRWLKALWTSTAFGILGQLRIPSVIPRRHCRIWAETGWQDHLRALIDVGLIGADEVSLAENGTQEEQRA